MRVTLTPPSFSSGCNNLSLEARVERGGGRNVQVQRLEKAMYSMCGTERVTQVECSPHSSLFLISSNNLSLHHGGETVACENKSQTVCRECMLTYSILQGHKDG